MSATRKGRRSLQKFHVVGALALSCVFVVGDASATDVQSPVSGTFDARTRCGAKQPDALEQELIEAQIAARSRRSPAGVGVCARGADDRAIGLGADGGHREVRGGDDAGAGARAAGITIEDVGHIRLAAAFSVSFARRSWNRSGRAGRIGCVRRSRTR